MNRYNLSKKTSNLNNQIIMLDNDIEQFVQQQPQQLIYDRRFRSIGQKKVFLQQQSNSSHNQQEDVKLIKQKPVQQIRITYNESAEKLKLNNFFGSKKTLDRQAKIESPLNPQNRGQRSRRQHNFQDPNEKLAKLVQQQIQDRQRWENLQKQKQQMNDHPENNLLIINDKQSFQKITSQNKLKKISSQKFSALNIEKNHIFENIKEDDEQYIRATNKKEKTQESDTSPAIQKRKRQVSQIRPLKKKTSTYEVLNQHQYLKRNEQGEITNLKQKQQSPVQKRPASTLNLRKRRVIGLDIADIVQFNKLPLQKNNYIEGALKRDKSGMDNTFFPEYRIVFDEVNIIYAKKTMSGYDIATDPNMQNINIKQLYGHVKGNFKGSVYNLYEGNEDLEILVTICYSSQWSTQSVARQVEVYVKDPSIKYLQLDRNNPKDNSSNLKALYLQGQNKSQNKIRKFINKKPIYDSKTRLYGLDFGGKVTIPSVKNIILIDPDNPKQNMLTFGKYASDSFYLKVQPPFTPLAVMGYLMSSFNFKFVTQ